MFPGCKLAAVLPWLSKAVIPTAACGQPASAGLHQYLLWVLQVLVGFLQQHQHRHFFWLRIAW